MDQIAQIQMRETARAPLDRDPARGAQPAATGPKRVLSLDSGGFSCMATLAFLARIETLLRDQHGGHPGFRLGDYFDLIGGSGSGALIAAGLATGRTAEDMLAVLMDLARESVRGPHWRWHTPRVTWQRSALIATLHELFGSTPLNSMRLKARLAIVARRLDGPNRTMVLATQGGADGDAAPAFGMKGDDGPTIADAVRASLPTMPAGQPEMVRCGGTTTGAFQEVGSGIESHPALPLLLLATSGREERCAARTPAGSAQSQGLGWPAGADAVFLISVGAVRPRAAAEAVMASEMSLRTMGVSMTAPGHGPAGIAGFQPEALRAAPSFTYGRYALDLSHGALQSVLGRAVPYRELLRLEQARHLASLGELLSLSRDVAARQVRTEHFPAKFRRPDLAQ